MLLQTHRVCFCWQAAYIRAGDALVLLNGSYVVIERIQHEILEAPISVYNFEVEDFHTYYVGNAKVLVHNRCDTYNLNGLKKIKYLVDRGWNDKMIKEAILNGKQGTTINMATLAECSVYRHPNLPSNQYVIIENYTFNIVQVSNIYDENWVPDSRIQWLP